ncbi:MAG: hypothetical protein SOI44_04850 [Lactimicrobium sp.]|uniref:hypothetical protein n=1 Tax=Lactimicrobium sp. TaxID=2563780 RepID=UPI002F350CA4
MMPIANRLSRQYYVILATYDGYDGTGSIFQDEHKEAESALQWLQSHHISSLAMAHSTSMGAEVLMAFVQQAQNQSRQWWKPAITLHFPEIPKQTQRKFTFLWGAVESAKKSEKTVRQSHPYANYLIIPGYKHCDYQVCAPDAYLKTLQGILQ